MLIYKECEKEKLVIRAEGRIDTTTADQFSKAVGNLEGIEELILDFQKVTYMSSAGIRVILSAYKKMCSKGPMKLTNVNDTVYSALAITGFTEKLTIERARGTKETEHENEHGADAGEGS